MSNADAIVHSMVSCAKVSGAMCGPPACQMRACEFEFPDGLRLAQGGSHGSHSQCDVRDNPFTARGAKLQLTLTARGEMRGQVPAGTLTRPIWDASPPVVPQVIPKV